MFTTASYALAEMVSDADLQNGCVYPRISQLKDVSLHVASRILENMQATEANSALVGKDIEQELAAHIWEPVYLPYRRV